MASAVFRTNLRRILTYEGTQPAKNGAILCEKYSPGLFGSCAATVKEEDNLGNVEGGQSLHVGAFSLESNVSYVHC